MHEEPHETKATEAEARVGLRLLIAGGGTGGHLFPGVAVAEEVIRAGGTVRFVGTARGLEARVLPTLGYELELIDVAGLKGQGFGGILRGVLRLPKAAWQSLGVLRRFRPHVVLGVGGYASGPLVALAWLLGVPTAILEQNSYPGLTNRWLSRVVQRIFTTFDDASGVLPPAKTVHAGNPLRRAIVDRFAALSPGPRDLEAPLRVLVFGGSQGARALNDVCVGAIHGFADPSERLELWHQTGATDLDRVQAAYHAAGVHAPQVRVGPFIDDMAAAYAWADVAVCRAGATSLAELQMAGCPALLVPFPHATDNHQEHNARGLVAAGAARLLPQAELTPERLLGELRRLREDRQHLWAMGVAMRSLARPAAAREVAQALGRLRG